MICCPWSGSVCFNRCEDRHRSWRGQKKGTLHQTDSTYEWPHKSRGQQKQIHCTVLLMAGCLATQRSLKCVPIPTSFHSFINTRQLILTITNLPLTQNMLLKNHRQRLNPGISKKNHSPIQILSNIFKLFFYNVDGDRRYKNFSLSQSLSHWKVKYHGPTQHETH